MNTELLLTAVLVQIFLTLMLFIFLAKRKAKAIKHGDVDREKAALHNDAWPDYVLQISNNIQNQFQTPVLFYALSFAFIVIDAVDTLALAGAWAYVLSRLAHSYVHTTSNYVPNRMRIFIFSVSSLIYMAVLLAIRLS